MSAASRQRQRQNGCEDKKVAAALKSRATLHAKFVTTNGKSQRCKIPDGTMYGALETGQIVYLTKLGMTAEPEPKPLAVAGEVPDMTTTIRTEHA